MKESPQSYLGFSAMLFTSSRARRSLLRTLVYASIKAQRFRQRTRVTTQLVLTPHSGDTVTKRWIDALQLQEKLDRLVRHERELLNEILDIIIAADASRSFLELGHASLFAWLTNHFKYSESAAKRRIDAARLKKSVPAIECKLENGSLNLSTVSKAQSAIRAEEIRTKTKMTEIQKAKVVELIEGKTGLETEKILMAKFPEAQIFQKERARVLGPTEINISLVMTLEEYEVFQRTKELLSHAIPSGSPGKIVAALSRDFVKRNDPLVKRVKPKISHDSNEIVEAKIVHTVESFTHNCNAEDAENVRVAKGAEVARFAEGSEPVREVKGKSEKMHLAADAGAQRRAAKISRQAHNSRYIPSEVRREILMRDQHACQFRETSTGKICGSRYQVEVDHIQPWALGGKHHIENLRCLCAQHNRDRAVQTFGNVRVGR